MSNILQLNQPQVLSGLGTMTITSLNPGLYYANVQLTEVPPSGVTIVVNYNGSPVFTAPVLAPTQIAQQFKYSPIVVSATTDTITVVLSSSAAIDNLPNSNNVKSTITIGQGF
jgi:hypothetical protein